MLTIAWLGVAAFTGGIVTMLQAAMALAVPVACIWFPEVLGDLTTSFPGVMSSVPITRPSPARLVRALGWTALLILTVLPVVLIPLLGP